MNALKLKTLVLIPLLLLLCLLQACTSKDQEAFEKGKRAYEQGQKTEAIKHYNIAIQHNPKLVEAYYERSLAKALTGDKAGAVDDVEKAKQLYLEQNDMEGYNKAIERQNTVDDMNRFWEDHT
ncbi:MAG: tetratricopeptide repeat protein [Vampirovibrionales bacterium]